MSLTTTYTNDPNSKDGPGSTPNDRESLLSTQLPDGSNPSRINQLPAQHTRRPSTPDDDATTQQTTADAQAIRDLYDIGNEELQPDSNNKQSGNDLYNTQIRHGFAAEYQSTQYMNFLAEVSKPNT